MAIPIAMLGAGIFAKNEYLPAIKACPNVELKAVYSRSEASAKDFHAAASSFSSPELYFDSPQSEGRSLKDLLARDDIQAVITAVPIQSQPAIIRQALEAGKHVLSEKPLAEDVDTGLKLIEWHRGLASKPTWGCAENFRFMKPLRKGVELVKERLSMGGKIVTFRVGAFMDMGPHRDYWHTEWRKQATYQGGYFLDGGVHLTAGLRMLLGAAGDDVSHVAAFTGLVDEALPPVDTVNACISTNKGTVGSFTATWASPVKRGLEFEIILSNGVVVASPVDVVVKRKDGDGEVREESFDFGKDSGVAAEVAAFAQSIQTGQADPAMSPLEAIEDLRVVETILTSATSGTVARCK